MDISLENVVPGKTGHLRLLPNINRSGRVLPNAASIDDLKTNTKIDKELRTRRLSDKEIYSLMIVISKAERAANPKLTLEASYDPKLYSLLSASGIPRTGQDEQPFTLNLSQEYDDGTKSRGLQFFVEVQTFAGSPLLDATASQTMRFRILDDKGTALLTRATFSGADIRPSDVILLGDDAPADRVFMCDVGENGPSIAEFSDAAKAASVPLTIIPIEINNGDSWIQDQFQIAYTANKQTSQQVIVHLPRMASDSAMVPGTANLRTFVDTYFPSDAVGVIKDFWRIPIPVEDGTIKVTLEVAQSYVAFKQLSMASVILRKLLRLLFQIDPRARPEVPLGVDIFAERIAIDKVYAQLRARASGGTPLVASPREDKELRAQIVSAKDAIDRLSKAVFVQADHVGVNLLVDGEVKTLLFTQKTNTELNRFYGELLNTHSSRNYGGNIEVSPPTGDAPYGKILTGSVTSPRLGELLTSRGVLHPVVMAFTDWLEVGHIDEIAAFAPKPSGGFCLLRASPKLALAILDQLVDLQKGGTLVTRLLRGKKWLHRSTAGATDPLPPPNAYVRLLKTQRYDISGFDKPISKAANPTFGDAAFHDDRQFLVLNRLAEVDTQYAAMLSCADLLAVCRASNRAVEDLFLSNSFAYADDITYRRYYDNKNFQENVFPFRFDKVASEAFANATIYPLPVMFDFSADFLSGRVSALVPAAVNFQTLGKAVMVPRPYGPRLRVADAYGFVNTVIAKLGYPKASLDEKYIRSRGLDKTWHWTRASERVSRASLSNVPSEFDKNFQEMKTLKARSQNQNDPMGQWVDAIAPWPYFDLWNMEHANDPLKNHPVTEPETLYRIAGYFKDGFDAFKNYTVDFCRGDTEQAHPAADRYESEIKSVMDKIRAVNPGVFDNEGLVVPKDWTRTLIPEDTTDVFELYTQALMESLGLTVYWIDSWYYHTHKGGIHCGTNALRSFVGGS